MGGLPPPLELWHYGWMENVCYCYCSYSLFFISAMLKCAFIFVAGVDSPYRNVTWSSWCKVEVICFTSCRWGDVSNCQSGLYVTYCGFMQHHSLAVTHVLALFCLQVRCWVFLCLFVPGICSRREHSWKLGCSSRGIQLSCPLSTRGCKYLMYI